MTKSFFWNNFVFWKRKPTKISIPLLSFWDYIDNVSDNQDEDSGQEQTAIVWAEKNHLTESNNTKILYGKKLYGRNLRTKSCHFCLSHSITCLISNDKHMVAPNCGNLKYRHHKKLPLHMCHSVYHHLLLVKDMLQGAR